MRATVTGTGISYITITEGSDNGNVTLMDDITYTPAAAATPEPGSITLFAGMSLTGAAVMRRRKAARKAE